MRCSYALNSVFALPSQNEMLDYFDSLSAEEAVEALENLEAYEHYAAKGGAAAAAPAANAGPTLPSQSVSVIFCHSTLPAHVNS